MYLMKTNGAPEESRMGYNAVIIFSRGKKVVVEAGEGQNEVAWMPGR